MEEGRRRTHAHIRKYTNTQIYKYADTQIRKYTNTHKHKYANTQIRLVVKLSLCEHQLARLKASKSPQWKFLRRYIISLDISQYTNVEINSDIRLLYYEYGHSHGSLLLNIVRNQSEINFLITCLSSISIYRYILASPGGMQSPFLRLGLSPAAAATARWRNRASIAIYLWKQD